MCVLTCAGCATVDADTLPAAPTKLPVTPVATATSTAANPSPTPPEATGVPTRTDVLRVGAVAPRELITRMVLPGTVRWVQPDQNPDWVLLPLDSSSGAHAAQAEWVYALVAAFPTVSDDISFAELMRLWRGEPTPTDQPVRLILSAETHAVLTKVWGAADPLFVRVVAADGLLEQAWEQRSDWAIIPFEQIEPRWKVLRINQQSPLDQDFQSETYLLTVRFGWRSSGAISTPAGLLSTNPISNREAERFTSLLLTGTTALVRRTAERMEQMGTNYPAEDIGDWLRNADIAHISNEVSFYEDCPPALPLRRGQRFCSDPAYIELLRTAGVDVIELTGNHLLDWGTGPFLYTLELYQREGFRYYGGGSSAMESRQPLLIEHNGNRLALIGCNRAGPENIWAGEEKPGPAECDFEFLRDEIPRLAGLGYLPVVTFQHYEVENFKPMNLTLQEFEQVARMGAVIVSGSQAHFAHGFGFSEGRFMHYGLGNLFFDQMFPLHRRQFLDRHIFYDGRYLGVELLTALLEDYARPRPMTPEERREMLETYFRVSGWLPEE